MDSKEADKWDNLTVEDWLVSEISNVAARGILRGIVVSIHYIFIEVYFVCIISTTYT